MQKQLDHINGKIMFLKKTNKVPAKRTGLYYLLENLDENKTYGLEEIYEIIDEMKSSDFVPEEAKRYVNDNLKSNVKTFALPQGFFKEVSPPNVNRTKNTEPEKLDQFWAEYKKEIIRIDNEELEKKKEKDSVIQRINKLNQELEQIEEDIQNLNRQRSAAKEKFDKCVNPFAKGNSDDNLAAA